MEDLCVKVDIAPQFKREFELALARVLKEFVRQFKLSLSEEILSKSKFTEEDANALGEKVKEERLKELKSKGIL